MEHLNGLPQTPFHMPRPTKGLSTGKKTFYYSQLQANLWVDSTSLIDLLVCYLHEEQIRVDEVCGERGHPPYQSGGNEQCSESRRMRERGKRRQKEGQKAERADIHS